MRKLTDTELRELRRVTENDLDNEVCSMIHRLASDLSETRQMVKDLAWSQGKQ